MQKNPPARGLTGHFPGESDQLELVRLAASGDPEAQRQLLQKLQRRIRTVALAILGNPLDADDACQSIMIEILKSADTYRGDNLRAWADRIAARTAMRHAHDRRVRAARAEPEQDVDDLRAPAPSSPDHDLPRPVIEYLSVLPEARRVALVLHHVMGYSVPEIAELTGTSPNTVKDRLLHARRQMRRLIRRDLALSTVKDRGAHGL